MSVDGLATNRQPRPERLPSSPDITDVDNDSSAFDDDPILQNWSPTPFDPRAWTNVCDSFIDILADQIEKWFENPPSYDEGDEKLTDYVDTLEWSLYPVVYEIGGEHALEVWHRAKVWFDINVSIGIRKQFVANAKKILKKAENTNARYYSTRARQRGMLIDELRYAVKADLLSYLRSLSTNLRPLAEQTGQQNETPESNGSPNSVGGSLQIGTCADFSPQSASETERQLPDRKAESAGVSAEGKEESVYRRLLCVYTKKVSDDRFGQMRAVLANRNLIVNEKLTKIHDLLPIPPTASAEALAELCGVKKQSVLKTAWWQQNRRGENRSIIGRRHELHKERAKQVVDFTDENE